MNPKRNGECPTFWPGSECGTRQFIPPAITGLNSAMGAAGPIKRTFNQRKINKSLQPIAFALIG